ncbi:hypothetical protein [Burkholderia ubonensis]|uniref:hypothetical protein n=1 Tax=Burkholderia ubonensis TaxID=101571 RepID=UPI000B06482D|nr:hypothetical protein [Burkholderia ubonensis]
MAQKLEPFKFIPHVSDVGHSMAIGPIGSGKTVPAELVKLSGVGRPGGSTSVTKAADNDGE